MTFEKTHEEQSEGVQEWRCKKCGWHVGAYGCVVVQCVEKIDEKGNIIGFGGYGDGMLMFNSFQVYYDLEKFVACGVYACSNEECENHRKRVAFDNIKEIAELEEWVEEWEC